MKEDLTKDFSESSGHLPAKGAELETAHDGKVVTLGVILNNHKGIWSNNIDHKDECEEE